MSWFLLQFCVISTYKFFKYYKLQSSYEHAQWKITIHNHCKRCVNACDKYVDVKADLSQKKNATSLLAVHFPPFFLHLLAPYDNMCLLVCSIFCSMDKRQLKDLPLKLRTRRINDTIEWPQYWGILASFNCNNCTHTWKLNVLGRGKTTTPFLPVSLYLGPVYMEVGWPACPYNLSFYLDHVYMRLARFARKGNPVSRGDNLPCKRLKVGKKLKSETRMF